MKAKAKRGVLGKKIAEKLEQITLEKVADGGFANAHANSTRITQGKNIAALQNTDLMEGQNALIIAAGPSLYRQNPAENIKKSNFKGVIIATDSAMAWCLRNEILPDLVVALDSHPHRIVRWFGDPDLEEESLSRDDYFTRQDMDPKFRRNQLSSNKKLIGLINKNGSKIRLAIASCVSKTVAKRAEEAGMEMYWWNPMYDDFDLKGSLTRKIHTLNGLPCVNTGGNVGSACWVFAHAVLKKRRIGLLGVDFGYYPETPYRQTQYYYEILDLVGPGRLNEVFLSIYNPYTKLKFYTDPAYLWYRNVFLKMARQAGCKTYNCTGGGILFGPFIHWTSLEKFFKGSGD